MRWFWSTENGEYCKLRSHQWFKIAERLPLRPDTTQVIMLVVASTQGPG